MENTFPGIKDAYIEHVIRNSVKNLQYSGFENGTFFEQGSEYHVEAYAEVLAESTETIREALLDSANSQLDNGAESSLLYEMLSENLQELVENRVSDKLYEMYFG